jgi:hypothetical protein
MARVFRILIARLPRHNTGSNRKSNDDYYSIYSGVLEQAKTISFYIANS